jgi:hypothetical protein
MISASPILLETIKNKLERQSGIQCPQHPLSAEIEKLTFHEMAAKYAREINPHLGQPHDVTKEPQAALAALNTQDFGMALSDVVVKVILRRYNATQEYRRLCKEIEVTNYKEIELPGIDLPPAFSQLGEGGEYFSLPLLTSEAGSVVQLKTYGRIVRVTRRLLVNDMWGAVAESFREIAAGLNRFEDRYIWSMLEANPTLADGQPLFGPDNQVSATLIDGDLGALAQGVAALRMQKTVGGDEPVGNAPSFLCVSPAQEVVANHILQHLAMRMIVVASPHIPPGRWYIFANPDLSPVLIRPVLAMHDPVRVEYVRAPAHFDGIAFRVAFDSGIAIQSRVGVVRGGHDL